jgi:hypothetical protein
MRTSRKVLLILKSLKHGVAEISEESAERSGLAALRRKASSWARTPRTITH